MRMKGRPWEWRGRGKRNKRRKRDIRGSRDIRERRDVREREGRGDAVSDW